VVKQQVEAGSVPMPVQMIGQEHQITIYVAQHCATCDYSFQVAAEIRREFPHVQVRIVDLEQTTEAIPEAVFATPTYLLNGRVWSLGNPSPAQVEETLSRLSHKPGCSAND
jgi:predicted thioredoxin/glutaredoxin